MKIQLIDFGGKSPERAYANDAGADVFSPGYFTVVPGQVIKIPLGFGLRIPDGYAGYIFPRSGLSAKGIVCDRRLFVCGDREKPKHRIHWADGQGRLS